MKPIIGVTPLYDNEKESIWMLPDYTNLIEACGAVPVILPLTEDEAVLQACVTLCDGFLFTGGQDVDPALYNQSPVPQLGELCVLRDRMEEILFAKILECDKPVLGICRGIQVMNVLLGGTLYQDLPTQHPYEIRHSMEKPCNRPAHTVQVLENTLLASILGAGEYGVNSCHHQAVRDLAPCAEPMAISEDGLVEALSVPGKRFAAAVQWHPEMTYDTDPKCCLLMQAFVDAARR